MTKKHDDSPFHFGDGDIKVAATHAGKPIVFTVSSSALVLASPVWKKFIYPPFPRLTSEDAGGDGEEDVRLDFTEDDSDALVILLSIAHLRFDKVPHALKYKMLLQVAVLCDQYDAVRLVRPWLDGWLASEGVEAGKVGQENWLFIAWVFGREDVFAKLALRLSREISIDEATGSCLNVFGDRIVDPMPPDIIDAVKESRLDSIAGLLNLPNAELDRFATSRTVNGCKSNLCKAAPSTSAEAKKCNAMTYGSLMIGLHEWELWPAMNVEECILSVNELGRRLSKLEILGIGVVSVGNGYGRMEQDHSDCSVRDFREQVATVLGAVKSPVRDSHRRHMEVA